MNLELTEKVHILIGETLGQRQIAEALGVSQATVSRRAKMNGSEEVKKTGGQCALTVKEEVHLLHDMLTRFSLVTPHPKMMYSKWWTWMFIQILTYYCVHLSQNRQEKDIQISIHAINLTLGWLRGFLERHKDANINLKVIVFINLTPRVVDKQMLLIKLQSCNGTLLFSSKH